MTPQRPQPRLTELQQAGRKQATICPSCGSSTLIYEEGCVKCHACGHSEC